MNPIPIIKAFEEKINKLKSLLYKNLIIYDESHTPGDLTPLNNYRGFLLKIFQYWSDIMYNPTQTMKLMMPTHEIQQIFAQLTEWYILNVLKTNDSDLRADILHLIRREYEKDPLHLG